MRQHGAYSASMSLRIVSSGLRSAAGACRPGVDDPSANSGRQRSVESQRGIGRGVLGRREEAVD
jgi:hypothetical protein